MPNRTTQWIGVNENSTIEMIWLLIHFNPSAPSGTTTLLRLISLTANESDGWCGRKPEAKSPHGKVTCKERISNKDCWNAWRLSEVRMASEGPVYMVRQLIPGIIAACRWGVESGKLVYSSTFGHVPTGVYMSHRPNESFVLEQQRK